MPYLHVALRWKEPLGRADSPRLRDLWVRSRCSAGEVLAAVLLPDQLDLVLHADAVMDPVGGLSAVADRAGLVDARSVGTSIPDGPAALHRVLAGVLTRPSRLGIVDDPLAWPWSTARDVLGAVVDPWIGAEALATEAGCSVFDLLGGTCSPPHAAHPSDTPSLPIGEMLRAAAAATRRPVTAVRRPGPTRRLFVGLAHRHGWWMPRRLASICGVARRTIYGQLERVPASWLRAGDLCLGDDRLRTIVLASPGRRGSLSPLTEERGCSSR